MHHTLWKYCTAEHCREMLLSFYLLGDTDWSDDKQIACLYAVSNHAKKHYRPARIPKHNGSFRRLVIPDPLLKRIQRNILHHILNQMPVSPYASAYHKGSSILSNASPHTGSRLVLKLDIKDFFGSILFPMVHQKVFSGLYFPPSIGVLLTYLCCYQDYLPQGAPTSCTISNLVMKPFDEYMGGWCSSREITYTRYCDDLTLSGDFDPHTVICKVRAYLLAMGFVLNEKKTKILFPQNRQEVTGITVNQKPQVPKEYRKALRQEVFYCTKFGVESHLTRIKDGRYLPDGQNGLKRYLKSLTGRINFVIGINPEDIYFTEKLAVIRNMEMKLECK